MQSISSRHFSNLITISNNNQIIWNDHIFREALNRANGRYIIIIIVLGKYQVGKTSFIRLATRNEQHVIGNRTESQAEGVTIDGPYSIIELAENCNIEEFRNYDGNEAIFFIDIEGFDAFNRGETIEEISTFYSKLILPLISISSCAVYIGESTSGASERNQIISALNLNTFLSEENNIRNPHIIYYENINNF